MRCLVVFCHPSETSFGAAILETARTAIRGAGHELRVIDLYREGFDPVLSTEEWNSYLPDTARNIAALRDHVEAMQWAEVARPDLSHLDVRPSRDAQGLARACLAAGCRLRDPARPEQEGDRTVSQHQAIHGNHDIGIALVVAVPDPRPVPQPFRKGLPGALPPPVPHPVAAAVQHEPQYGHPEAKFS